MKVLSVTNLNLGLSATIAERNLFKGLQSMGVDITVAVSVKNPESEELESAGVKVVYIPVRKKIDPAAIRIFRSLVRREKYDIVHMTYSTAMTNIILATTGMKTKLVGYIGAESVHWHDPSAYLSFLNPAIDKMICLSNGVREHMIRQSSAMRKKAVRIYKGYNPAWTDNVIPADRSGLDIPDNAMVICCVANVRRIKGIPYLLKAADLLPESLPIYFILVGPGMDSLEIAMQIRRLKYRNNFRVKGYTPDVLSYVAACDLYVQPSLTEGLGRSVIEAMCLRKPVIASGTGGVEELVEEGITGYHVRGASPEAIAEKIMICHNNRERLPEMGIRGRERIARDFSIDRMVTETHHLFSSMESLQ